MSCVKHQNTVAFTLVEMLVVIAIISLLALLITPAVQSARKAALKKTCLSNLRQIGVAVNSYATENKAEFPWSRIGGHFWNSSPDPDESPLSGYLGYEGMDFEDFRSAKARTVFRCPVFPIKTHPYQYIANASLMAHEDVHSDPEINKVTKVFQLNNPASLILIADRNPEALVGGPVFSYGSFANRLGEIHGHQMNVLYADMHVSGNIHIDDLDISDFDQRF
jgi:prepilin-type N-terminal cleavage/methylation domain-containing protein/prepilin-type processing-associated H-X9-DG protein